MNFMVVADKQYRYGRIEQGFERALDGVEGSQIVRNLAKRERVDEITRLSVIDLRVKAAMFAEAHDRRGQSMRLATTLRQQIVSADRAEINRLRLLARDFDERTFELFRLGWLDKSLQPCADFLSRTIDARISELEAAKQKQRARKMVRLASRSFEGSIYAM